MTSTRVNADNKACLGPSEWEKGRMIKRGEGRNMGQQGVIIFLSATHSTGESERGRERLGGCTMWCILTHILPLSDTHTYREICFVTHILPHLNTDWMHRYLSNIAAVWYRYDTATDWPRDKGQFTPGLKIRPVTFIKTHTVTHSHWNLV